MICRFQKASHVIKSVNKSTKVSCTAGMTQLSQRLSLDLTNTLTCNVKFLADLFQRAASSVVKTEAQLYHMLLTRCKRVKLAVKHLAQNGLRRGVCRSGSFIVGYEIAQMSILLLADRRFKRYRLL